MQMEYQDDAMEDLPSMGTARKLWGKLTHRVSQPGMTDRECQGLPLQVLLRRLQEAGFYKIRQMPAEDLTYRRRELLNTVISVTIAGEEEFHRNTEFPFDSEIQVTFHTFKQIPVGFTPQQLRKSNVCELRDYFKRQGFGRIQMVPIRDLKMGWLKIDGQVESVLMDGFNLFHADSLFPADSEITLYYHTFQK